MSTRIQSDSNRLPVGLQLAVAVLCIFTAGVFPACGQDTVLWQSQGSNTWHQFGQCVARAGYVNADGVEDLIVGSLDLLSPSGSASVFCGATGSLIHSFSATGGDRFGCSVAGAGDVNGDGRADVIVGAWQASLSGPGYANVYSGSDGSLIYNFQGSSAGDHLGFSVAGAGDIDGDGFADVMVGATQDDNSGSGYVKVFSGTGALIHHLTAPPGIIYWLFGRSVASVGDVDVDGVPDIIVGNGRGIVDVFSGASGAKLFTITDPGPNSGLGESVSGLGDVSGDGVPDLLAGFGSAYPVGVFSGASGALLYAVSGTMASGQFGRSVSGAGDLDGDSFPDFIVGVPQVQTSGGPGGVCVYSGATGGLLYQLNGTGIQFGRSVAGLSDIDGDGIPDLAVGNPSASPAGITYAGEAMVFAGPVPLSGVSIIVGGGYPASSGQVPVLTTFGVPAIGNVAFTLRVFQIAANQQVSFFGTIGPPVPPTQVFPGCFVYLDLPQLINLIALGVLPLGPMTAGVTGSAILPVAIPMDPALAGSQFMWQIAFPDPLPGCVATSNGLLTVIQ